MHKLLQRQLRQSRKEGAADEVDLAALFELIDAAYSDVDRERRIMAHAYQVMRDEHGALLLRQMKTHDMVTRIRAEKAEAERARAVAESELLKKERLSALGQLTATVAHELRNPLSSIRNTIFTVREQAKAKGMDLDRPMSRIERSIGRCDEIIADLLEYARSRDLRRSAIELDHWLGEVLDEQKIPDGIRIERRLGAPTTRVQLDVDRFRRVIINLIDNATQALADAGSAISERRITVATRVGEMAEILVEDTGPGIAPETMTRVFEPFFSTKAFGTGLGLPTVKQIVEQHGGSITIDSAPGTGTRIDIHLPLGEAEAEQQETAAA
jgi:signal transduction histidine kinase